MFDETAFFATSSVCRELGQDIISRDELFDSEDGSDLSADSRRLSQFAMWLYGVPSASGSVASERKLRMRFAPSIILRSEAELLAVSCPRFAVRVYVSERSFVNARRRRTLQRAIRRAYADSIKGDQFREQLLRDVDRSSWIADSLLEVPDDIKARFTCLTTRLATSYGEREEFDAVPFVTHIRLGGGLCAQAVCFMTLCLLPDVPVMGPSEITAHMHNLQFDKGPAGDCFIEIGGMTPESIVAFFRDDKIRDVTTSKQIYGV
ncbi:MAG: hypothetical protein KDA59_25020, partial [Planctomycetales bacterium]|nr:hypothetical protein [Planctomycetales bacterium]